MADTLPAELRVRDRHALPCARGQVTDKVGLLSARTKTVAEAELFVGSIPSANPIYVWVPLWKQHKGAPVHLSGARGGR